MQLYLYSILRLPLIVLPQILQVKQKAPTQKPSKVWYILHKTTQDFQFRMDSYTST